MGKILVGCEYSGTVREAFAAHGHYAVSCDILAGEPSLFDVVKGHHYQGDVRALLLQSWDLFICHPPCTFLSFAGKKYWNDPGRAEKRARAMDFFSEMLTANVGRICVENPLGEPIRYYPDYQIINPYLFGEPFRKRTLLWLKNLPDLLPTDIVVPIKFKNKKGNYVAAMDMQSHGGGDLRRKTRAKFFKGIAHAMADQWGCLC